MNCKISGLLNNIFFLLFLPDDVMTDSVKIFCAIITSDIYNYNKRQLDLTTVSVRRNNCHKVNQYLWYKLINEKMHALIITLLPH